MSRLLLRRRAEDDIAETWSYIAEDSEAQADAFIGQLTSQFELLALRPTLGRPRGELASLLRSSPIGRYVIYYKPIAGGISVVRVLHSARDIGRIFKPTE